MGKRAGILKKGKYYLQKIGSKGLKALSMLSGTLSGLAGAEYALNGILNPISSTVGTAASLVPVVGGQIGREINHKKYEKLYDAGIWGAAAAGLNTLGKFINAKDSKIIIHGIAFDKYQINDVNGADTVYLTNKNDKRTMMISYDNNAMWKCSLKTTKDATSIVVPERGNLVIRTNFIMVNPKILNKQAYFTDKADNSYSIEYIGREAKSIEILSDNSFKVFY